MSAFSPALPDRLPATPADPSAWRYRTLGIGMVCLIACVFLTLLAWKTARASDERSIQAEFDRRSQTLARLMNDRMEQYQQALRSAVGLWTSSQDVTLQEWKSFADALELNANYPGVQGLGFMYSLESAQVAEFEAQQSQARGKPYRIFPEGQRACYAATTYLEPMDFRNARAIGFDHLSESVRREAVLRARDTGAPALSGRVTLLQETEKDRQAGALLYLPVYRPGQAPNDVATRRAQLFGWVYSPFRMADLMYGTLREALPELRLQVYDGDSLAPSQAMFDSMIPSQREDLLYSRRSELTIAGHRWTFVVTALSSFADSQPTWAPFVLLTGLAISGLVFLVVLTLLRSEARAREIAEQIGLAFRESEGKHQAIVQAASEAILTIDERGQVKTFSGGGERIFGYAAGEVVGHDIALLLADHDRAATKELLRRFFEDDRFGVSRREATGRRKGGGEIAVTLSVGLLQRAPGAEAVVLLQDANDRKLAEAAAAEADHLQKLLFGAVPYPVIATGNDGVISFVNQAAELDLGYAAAELVGRKSVDAFHIKEEVFDRRLGSSQFGKALRHSTRAFEVLTADCEARGSSEREWTYVRKDGSSFPAIVSISRVTDRTGAKLGFIFLVVDISERKETEVHIRHLAHHDALTDLPNRTLLNERLAHAVSRASSSEGQVGVLMLDLDHFKRINDTLGHEIGDGLLIEISSRIRALVRREDTVARMGGDEFVIVLPDVPGADKVGEIARKIVEGVFRPVTVAGHELQVSGSVGVALYPRDGGDEGTLLRNADAAMYAAKQRGRANFQWYSRSMMKVAEEKMALEADLRRAIDAGQLTLAYQPFVCLKTGEILGLEALLRWSHPDRGLISPSVFVPLAEEAGLIVRLGEWVLGEACKFGHELSERAGQLYPISVNVSPRQLAEANFATRVQDIARFNEFPPQSLVLEITESIMVDHPEEAMSILGALRANGTQIAIDDFGTGYSSLAYITRFPVDKLKIDRSFIGGIGHHRPDGAITNAIIAMARSLQLQVIAEGVEDAEQLGFLIEQQCHAAQGFLFGEMTSVEEILAFALRSRRSLDPRLIAPSAVTVRH